MDICTQDGSSAEISLDCEQKITLALAIEGGSDFTTEFQFSVTEVKGENGENLQLQADQLVIGCKKGLPSYIYPLQSSKMYYYNALEEVILPSGIADNCVASATSKSPTCQWDYDKATGKIIQFSQGFCCTCGLKDSLLGQSENERLKYACQKGVGSSCAFCLRYEEPKFQAMEIGPPKTDWSILCRVRTLNKELKKLEDQDLVISTSKPIARSTNGRVIGRLIGDFAPSVQPFSFESKYFFYPFREFDHPMVMSPANYSMIIDKHLVSTDGLECDKIGSSYAAHTNQPNKCNTFSGACMRNQLKDVYEQDLERVKNGNKPQYLMSQFDLWEKVSQNSTVLRLGIKEMSKTLITLEVNADKIQMKRNKASGIIVNTKLDGFEALTEGRIFVQIQNTGTLKAEFILSVSNCSTGTSVSPAQSSTLSPNQTHTTNFTLQTSNPFFNENECDIVLQNNLGEELQRKKLLFNTTLSTPDEPITQIEYDEIPIISDHIPEKKCKCSLFNIICVIFSFSLCIIPLLITIGTILAIIVFVIISIKLGICFCRRMRKNRKKKTKKEAEEEEVEEEEIK
ncbi:MAG: putative Hapless, partial [Streblomastix strix]